MQRVSDTVVEFHLDEPDARWLVWQKIRGNRTVVMVVCEGTTYNTGSPYNKIGFHDTLRLMDVSSQTHISKL